MFCFFPRILATVSLCFLLAGCNTSDKELNIEKQTIKKEASTETATQQAAEIIPQTPSEYRLTTGDQIYVHIYGEEELSGVHKLHNNGVITMPLIGEVNLNNLNFLQASEKLNNQYSNGYLNKADVTVSAYAYRPYYMVGAIQHAGRYEWDTDITLHHALAIAGGTEEKSDRISFLIKRLDGIFKTKNLDTKIIPGDIITVIDEASDEAS